jgi:hypothetical protein
MVISKKLPIVKDFVTDLTEIITLVQMYQNDMRMVLDRYTALQEGFGVKPRYMENSLTHVKIKEKTREELLKT